MGNNLKLTKAIENLYFSDFKKFFESSQNPFILMDLAHADENANTRVLSAILKHISKDGRLPFLESFLSNVLGIPSCQIKNAKKIEISTQKEAVGLARTGFIDLYINYATSHGNERQILIENKINGAGDTKEQICRYIYSTINKGVKSIDGYKQWKSDGYPIDPAISDSLYVVYLTRDGEDLPGNNSLPSLLKENLKHFCTIGFAEEILNWLVNDVLQQCPFGKDGLMQNGLQQYIAYLKSIKGSGLHWPGYATLRKRMPDINDRELYDLFDSSIKSFAESVKKRQEDSVAVTAFISEMNKFREEIYSKDVDELEGGWKLHFTPSFINLYKKEWCVADKSYYSVPTISFVTDTRSFLKGNPKKAVWKLCITHISPNIEKRAEAKTYADCLFKVFSEEFGNAVRTCEEYNHGRNADVIVGFSVDEPYNVNDSKSRAAYYQKLIQSLPHNTEARIRYCISDAQSLYLKAVDI